MFTYEVCVTSKIGALMETPFLLESPYDPVYLVMQRMKGGEKSGCAGVFFNVNAADEYQEWLTHKEQRGPLILRWTDDQNNLTKLHPDKQSDPIWVSSETGYFWYSNELWTEVLGPFEKLADCRASLKLYCESL